MRLLKTDFRRGLRQATTPAERRLWSVLRDRRLGGLKFRRQHSLGPYVLDFYCRKARLAIEVDGSIHDDPARAAADTERQRAIERAGIRVLRVTNDEVLAHTDLIASRIAEVAGAI